MKYSAQICTEAIQFALSKNAVRTVLGPIDSDPKCTILQVSAKLKNADEASAVLEIVFDYLPLTDHAKSSDVTVTVKWHKGSVGFVLQEVHTSEN